MVTTLTAPRWTSDHVAATASRVYDAECVLHIAHQSHLDEWITAASDKLHVALVEHLAAIAEAEAQAA
jgi:hypothetical protein